MAAIKPPAGTKPAVVDTRHTAEFAWRRAGMLVGASGCIAAT